MSIHPCPEFSSPQEKQEYEDAWHNYMNKKQAMERIGKSFHLNVKSTPYSNMKKMSKLQKAYKKGFEEGLKQSQGGIDYWRKCLNDEKEFNQSLRKELEVANQRIKSLRGVMQSINTISQGTSTL